MDIWYIRRGKARNKDILAKYDTSYEEKIQENHL